MKWWIIVVLPLLVACKAYKSKHFKPDFSPGPAAIVYKTKADYSKLVPVTLSDDKTEIISYPHPKDIQVGDSFQYPTQLANGYWLDNRGVSKNTVFIKLNYEAYSKLTEAPSLGELYALIIDKDPFIEICNCGNKNAFSNVSEQLNGLIKAKRLKKVCKKL